MWAVFPRLEDFVAMSTSSPRASDVLTRLLDVQDVFSERNEQTRQLERMAVNISSKCIWEDIPFTGSFCLAVALRSKQRQTRVEHMQ